MPIRLTLPAAIVAATLGLVAPSSAVVGQPVRDTASASQQRSGPGCSEWPTCEANEPDAAGPDDATESSSSAIRWVIGAAAVGGAGLVLSATLWRRRRRRSVAADGSR